KVRRNYIFHQFNPQWTEFYSNLHASSDLVDYADDTITDLAFKGSKHDCRVANLKLSATYPRSNLGHANVLESDYCDDIAVAAGAGTLDISVKLFGDMMPELRAEE
ncbi:hypothetical protein EV182_004181, partial [Spiromyces aspiralis]